MVKARYAIQRIAGLLYCRLKMPRRQPVSFRYVNGFCPSQDFLGVVPDSLISGENLIVFGDGLIRTAKGLGTATASGSPRPAMNLGSGFGGVSTYGSVILFYNILLAAGSGTVTRNGSSVGSVSDNLAIQAGGVLVPAGVPAPGAPTVSLTPPTAGRNIGSYSLALTAVRLLGPVTGESSRGTPSVPVSMINKKFRVTAWPATPSGCDATRDKWGLYFPFRGFPTQGPWRHLTDIPMNTGLPYDVDFLDGELGHLAPLDHDVPPAFKFVFSIDNVVVGVATGGQLWPSVPLQPDAFPPDKVVMLARGEDVVSCRSSGGSGRIALACANSLHEVVASGDDTISPIIAYPRWPTTGFDGHSCWCFHNDTIYGITGNTPVMGTLDRAPSPNMINGGGMMNSVDQYNTLYGGASVAADIDRLGRNWQTFSNSGTRIDRLAGGTIVSAGIKWEDTKGWLKLATNMQTLGGKPAVKLRKQIKAGETYTFSCLLAADSAVNNVRITIALVEQGVGDIIAKTTASNWLFSIINAADAWMPTLVAILKVPTNYVITNRQWVEMRFTGNTSDICYTTHWKLERGEGASIWVPHSEEDLLDMQSNIAPGSSGIPGNSSPGFFGSDGTKFGGTDGLLIGGLEY